jgi:uncharacterized protein YkwD
VNTQILRRAVLSSLLLGLPSTTGCIYFEGSGDGPDDAGDGGESTERDAGESDSTSSLDVRLDDTRPGPDTSEEPDAAPADGWPAAQVRAEDEVLRLINIERSEGAVCGSEEFGPTGPLEMDDVLRDVARAHSVDMGENNFFDHTNLDGLTPFDRMEAAGFNGGYPWGENIAAGQRSAQEVVTTWMNSPGHCSNIMDPEFGAIGIGYTVVSSSQYQHFWTQNFAGSGQR